jgi:hypothetical protein
MAISKTDGTKLWISPTPVVPDTIEAMTDANAIAFFAAINDWIEVGEVENLGEIGDMSQQVTFLSLDRQRVRKLKGSRDAGEQSIVVGRDPLDDGQAAMVAAEATNYNYAFKLDHPDAQSASYADSVTYYCGLVGSKRMNLGAGNTVSRRTFNISVQLAYEVMSAAIAVPTVINRPTILGTSLSVAAAAPLTAEEGTWNGSPTSYTYQWQNDVGGNGTFSNIVGATNKTYQPVAGDEGKAIRVQVTAHNSAGASTAANSLGVGLITA